MSFKCKKCGPVGPGRKQHRVITEVRDVTYLIQVKTLASGSSTIKTIKKTHGKEIVAEDIYCNKCIPKEVIPKVIEKVERKNIIATSQDRTRSY